MKCYLCNEILLEYLTKNGYRIYRCPSCRLGVTLLGKDYHAFVEEQYSKGYFTGDPTKNAYVSYKNDKQYIEKNLSKFLKEVCRYKKEGTLLDVGCAMGYFVDLARKAGFDAYGFDPSEYAVSEAKVIAGVKNIQKGTIDTVKYQPRMFDVITLFDVFEHLNDPLSDIQRLLTFLKDDGIIVIATGDTGSLFARLMGRRWTFFNPPQHLFFYNISNLSAFLTRVNIQPIHWFRVGKWLSFGYVLHLASTISESGLARMLYSYVKSSFIARIPVYLPVGDNMVMIGKKQI